MAATKPPLLTAGQAQSPDYIQGPARCDECPLAERIRSEVRLQMAEFMEAAHARDLLIREEQVMAFRLEKRETIERLDREIDKLKEALGGKKMRKPRRKAEE